MRDRGYLRTVAITLCLASVVSCTTIPGNGIEDAVTIASTLVGPPLTQIPYSDAMTFDAQLYKSLAADLPEVTVSIDGAFKRDAFSSRMANWVRAVPESNTRRTCVLNDGAMSAFSIVALLLPAIWGQVKKYMMYKAVADYDVTTIVDKQSTVRQVIFTPKNKTTDCPTNTSPWNA